MTKTLLISHLLVVADAAAFAMDTRPELLPQTASAEQPFQPPPPGIPQRRLSGGTR
ncbi:hypothetical protein IXB50_07535 [Leptothoe spongobia TAU-MAC 1115]|uniref:Uncharacterized protein n=2 Tax=Leptothoe TaxID=2651725 RepID=A0A947DE82_9CYAN|nr:hypothetical protein [Leptothoe spongobia TAU-MAC 1115]